MTLAEDPNLELPFLIPEQGYSCDTMRGLPMGLEEYLEKAINAGMYCTCVCVVKGMHVHSTTFNVYMYK